MARSGRASKKNDTVSTPSEEPSAATKFPRRTARKERTRSRILAAATEEFRKSGFGATTMQAIADAADIHVTTLFLHFKSKNDIAINLTTSTINKLEEVVEASKGTVPFFDFFRGLVWTSANEIKSESDPTMTLWSELRNDHELVFAWSQYEQAQRDLFADYIAEEYGLDRNTSYLPDLVASLLVTSTLLPHKKWVESPGTLKLLEEVAVSIEIAERAAKDMLKAAPSK